MAASLFSRKSIDSLKAQEHGLRRTLSWRDLIVLGVGCIVGAGIYVMTGTAAAHFAGPAVILSFVLSAIVCGLVALCYAELSACIPVAGSSYTYAYATLGQVYAWGLAWLLMLEYGLAGSALAVGFGGYLLSFLADFNIHLPMQITTPSIATVTHDGVTGFVFTGGVNLIAAGALMISAVILCLGVGKSTLATTLLVILKLAVLLAFVSIGIKSVQPANWHPFIPANEGGFTYGWQGIVRAASILFFAYLGFETVSTASAEARNPQRDIPIGVLGSLAICTVLYMAVAAVLTGIVPFRQLGVPDPIAIAVDYMHAPIFSRLIKVGALAGLASVLMVNGYGHSRICFAMGKDGLIPSLFARLHPQFKTPAAGTLTVCAISAVFAAFLPISILGDLVSLGTAIAFAIVAFALIWLRNRHPDLPRPFRVPFGGFKVGTLWIGYVPLLAIIGCLSMVVPVLADVGLQAAHGDVLPATIISVYVALGVLIYVFYGRHNAVTPEA